MKKVILLVALGLLLGGCASPKAFNSPKEGLIVTVDSWANTSFDEIKAAANKKCQELNRGSAINVRKTGNDPIVISLHWYGFDCEKSEMKIIEEKKQEEKNKIKRDITFSINDKKEQCEAIGFVPQTEKFADCVLRLVELDVKSQQQKQIELAISQGNQQVANELKAQRNQQRGQYLTDLGQKLLNPPTKKTTRCTVTGTGSFRTVRCR